MKGVYIRTCKKTDKQGVIDVCYHTGYMGEDAKPFFKDKYLFGLMFCAYYPYFEPNSSLVAVEKINGKEKVVGYILCSFDSKRQDQIYKKQMWRRIFLRLFLVSSWKNAMDFKLILNYAIKRKISTNKSYDALSFYNEYPAHLHIDVLENYQHQGIGSHLMRNLEKLLIRNGIKGVCLVTSEKNMKAIPFYRKHGFQVLKTWQDIEFWPNQNVKSIIFGKKLN